MATLVKQGPCSGLGGPNAIIMDTSVENKLLAIRISHADAITAVQVLYEVDGQQIWSSVWGNSGNALDKYDLIELAPGEKLTSISGYFGPSGKYANVVKSLTFVSNFTVYGVYGIQAGRAFTLSAGKAGNIVGFHGNWGSVIDSLGIFAMQD